VSEWGGFFVLLVLVAIAIVGLWLLRARLQAREMRAWAYRHRLEEQARQIQPPPPVDVAPPRPFGSLPKGPLPLPALPPERITCPHCRQPTTAWRTYADGRRECLLCTLRKRKP
jgi:hypothetical protein